MINKKNAPKGLGALLNKNDTIIAILLTLIIADDPSGLQLSFNSYVIL